MNTTELIRSVVYGHAVADALGVPVEFTSRSTLQRNPVTDMRSYGTHNMPAGTWGFYDELREIMLEVYQNEEIQN